MYKDIFPKNYFLNNDTFDKFHVSLFYKNNVLNKEYYKYIYDDWYSSKGYGKLDTQNNVIYPKNSFLKEYRNNAEGLQKNLSFVVDAFKDLKVFYKQLEIRDKVSLGSIYVNLNAVSSYTPPDDMYVQYINDLYPIFETFFMINSDSYFPNSFEFYIKKIILFFRIMLKIGVVNRTSFMKSLLVPRASDGLRISLFKEPEIFSLKKVANTFVGDRGFDFFVKTSARFGFFVDKYRPWSIVADLNSPVMLEYAQKYNLKNKEEIYNNCYHKAYKVDLENLINVVITLWNLLASRLKTQTIATDSTMCAAVDRHTYELPQLDVKMFNHYFPITWQIRFYAYTRILEEKFYYPQEKFEILYKEACNINSLFGIEESLRYINTKILEFADRIEKKDYSLTSETEFSKLLLGQVNLVTKEELHF